MTIDETIKKYRKLSNSDRTCYPEEAAQIAEWMEELKERRRTNFDYVSLMDKRYYDGYDKAIDDFVEKFIYKAVCEGCSGCCNCYEESRQSECEDYKAYIEIAEQLKAGGTDE